SEVPVLGGQSQGDLENRRPVSEFCGGVPGPHCGRASGETVIRDPARGPGRDRVAVQEIRHDPRHEPGLRIDPSFHMHDAYPDQQVTVQDLFAHRSGLPGTAGNDLETLGFDRDTILDRLRLVEPIHSPGGFIVVFSNRRRTGAVLRTGLQIP
ncbi:MAG: beta-lactamase family protein, partial [Rhodospirillales bacterium]|nr:beta-lactamase family protein [Rhodospirillales bacterium]